MRLLTPRGHADVGKRLFLLFHQAGLLHVECRAEYAIGGSDCRYYDCAAEALRNMLPMVKAAGIATAAEVDIEMLAERLREEALRIGGFHAMLVIFGATSARLIFIGPVLNDPNTPSLFDWA